MKQRDAGNLFRSKLSGSGYITDDSQFPIRRLLLELKTILAVIKRRRLEKKQKMYQHDILTLPCVEMDDADIVDCPGIPPSGMVWAKSKEPLPRFIKLMDVVTLTGGQAIPVVDWNKARTRSTSRNLAIRNRPLATFRTIDDKTHLYILNDSVSALSAVIVPEDYPEALKFPSCGKLNKDAWCNPLDVEIGADYASIVEASDIVIGKEAQLLQIRPDMVNNDNPLQ